MVQDVTIGFVGAGKVARTLARAFQESGLRIEAVASRNRRSAETLGASIAGTEVTATAQEVADRSSLVFLTVSDDAIAPTCRSVRWRRGQFVVHCSGATPLDALASASDAGAMVGGFHPLQMFADPDVALRSLPGCATGIEAAEPLATMLRQLAERIGCRPFALPPGVRARYHASATYIGPFVIAVLREAAILWASFGIEEREAMTALVPLLRGTIEAVLKDGLAGGMGGCVARGDVGTVRAHLQAIDALSPAMGDLYRELTRRTIPLALARGTLAPDRAAEIEKAVSR